MAFDPRNADLSISQHLTCCSPCFCDYMALLSESRKRRLRRAAVSAFWLRPSRAVRAAQIIIGVVVLLAAAYLISRRTPTVVQQPPAHTGIPAFVIDLSSAAPSRGETSGAAPVTRLPATRISLTIVLPLGSDEGLYQLSLRRDGAAVWSHASTATLLDRRTSIAIAPDLSRVPPGRYSLDISGPAARLAAPILVENNATSIPSRAP
jgi:hypothetical protein